MLEVVRGGGDVKVWFRGVEGWGDVKVWGGGGGRYRQVGRLCVRDFTVSESGALGEGGGGGHCFFKGRYPLPNYRPFFSAMSTPQS